MYHSVQRNKKFVFTRGVYGSSCVAFQTGLNGEPFFGAPLQLNPKPILSSKNKKTLPRHASLPPPPPAGGGNWQGLQALSRYFRRYCSLRSPTGSVGSATSLSAKPVRNLARPFLFSQNRQRTLRTFAPAPGQTKRPVTGRPFLMALKVSLRPLKKSSFSGSLLVASRGST